MKAVAIPGFSDSFQSCGHVYGILRRLEAMLELHPCRHGLRVRDSVELGDLRLLTVPAFSRPWTASNGSDEVWIWLG